MQLVFIAKMSNLFYENSCINYGNIIYFYSVDILNYLCSIKCIIRTIFGKRIPLHNFYVLIDIDLLLSIRLNAGQLSTKKKIGCNLIRSGIREATEGRADHSRASQILIYSNSLKASSSKTEGNNIFI